MIPTLLSNGFGLVKGEAFASWRTVGTLVPAVRVFNSRDVDELLIVDVAARREERSVDLDTAAEAAVQSRVPLTVGGGVDTVEDVAELLAAGADKVVVNSAALAGPGLVEQAARRFGSQCVVVSVDVREVDGAWRCFSHSGSRPTERDPVSWAREAADRGAGEILVTRVEYDGRLTGYDIPLVASVAQAVGVPVIASGGAGSYADMLAAIREGGASAVAAGAMFQFTEQTPAEARDYLAAHGVPVRRGS
ncbi:imidazole glycerol phosphate synthase subunit HisF [Motilibacter aurantiacus]|uniref:imidazole glycerol phosphate synthase subunit HisF n=1 Tax=Motilibacter aurantiacus TaxID=2714955 RepID=UPI002F2B8C74